jgi:hypothetical protein
MCGVSSAFGLLQTREIDPELQLQGSFQAYKMVDVRVRVVAAIDIVGFILVWIEYAAHGCVLLPIKRADLIQLFWNRCDLVWRELLAR